MKFITLVLVLCANTLFGQLPISGEPSSGSVIILNNNGAEWRPFDYHRDSIGQFIIVHETFDTSGMVITSTGYVRDTVTIASDTTPPKRDTSHYTLELPSISWGKATVVHEAYPKFKRPMLITDSTVTLLDEGTLGVADGGAYMTTMTVNDKGEIQDLIQTWPVGDSLKDFTITNKTFLRDPSSRTLDLPQPWADSTEWDAPVYDPNFYFHKSHEWVYSEFDDLNQEYQKLYPYPLGGFEHQGRICRVCKTKQERTKYYGTGKNPFKKVSTNSPYSQLLLQGRQ